MGKLTAVEIKHAKPGRYMDGDGLMLIVKESGSGSWMLRVQFNGKRHDFGLGSLKVVSLKNARERALETRKLILAGGDPKEAKRTSRAILDAIPTFQKAAESLHGDRKVDWKNPKHQAQWLSTLKTYVFPRLGTKSIDKITAADILDALTPIWQSKPETARRVRQRIAAVLNWAHAKGYRPAEAPMSAVAKGLPKQKTRPTSFKALKHEEVAALMSKLAEQETVGRMALRFVILTATRSKGTRGATWDEIDLSAKVWTIPAERMKMGRELVVPLSQPALDILDRAAELRKGRIGELIFPGNAGKMISEMTMLKALRSAIGGKWTVHGFRSSFRDWVEDETVFSANAAEAALAHTIPNKSEAAYRRTNYLDKRREIMAAWANYIVPPPAVVAP